MTFENKIVVVLNEKAESGKATMALAHAMLGFGAGAVSAEEVKLNQYIDADGGVHANISEMPIVVLKTSSNKIRALRNLAQEHSVKFVDFTESMSIGTYEEEYELTKTLKDEDLKYWAIVLYGQWDLVSEWTKKFSLYR